MTSFRSLHLCVGQFPRWLMSQDAVGFEPAQRDGRGRRGAAQSPGNLSIAVVRHPLVVTSAANHEYRPGFSSTLMLKDLRLSQDAAHCFGAYTPLGARATDLYDDFVQAGNAELDLGRLLKR